MARSVRALVAVAVLAVAGGCGASGAARAPATEAARAGVVDDAAPFVITRGDAVYAVAADATHLYWADPGGLHRRRLGAPAEDRADAVKADVVALGELTAMTVDRGVVWLSDGAGVFRVDGAGGAVTPVVAHVGDALGQALPPITAIIATGDDVVVATATTIVRVSARGRAVALAPHQTFVTDIAVDGGYVYWTEYGDDPASVVPTPGDTTTPGTGAVRRVPLAGGAIETIAEDERWPAGVAVGDGRVWWGTALDGARSAPVGGGKVRVEAAGRFDRVVLTGGAAVLRNTNGALLEGDTVRFVPDAGWTTTPRPFVVTDGWIYAPALRPSEGTAGLIAVPRAPHPAATLAARTSDLVTKLRVRDGVLTWAANRRDGSSFVIVQQGADRRAHRLYQAPGYIADLAVGGRDVYFSDGSVLYAVTRRGTAESIATPPTGINGIKVHRNHVYWISGSTLWARRRSGGAPFQVAHGPGDYGSEYGVDLVFGDDHAYTTRLGAAVPGVFQIGERGDVQMRWQSSGDLYPSADLVRVSDELFFWANNAVYRLGADDSTPSQLWRPRADGYITDLVTGAGNLYVVVAIADYTELVRIDATTGDAATIYRWAQYVGEPGTLAADDTGVYVWIEMLDGIVKLRHGAPAILPTSWVQAER